MKHVQDKIQACLDGELPEAEAAAVQDHCQSCPECGRIWQETTVLWETVAAVPTPRLSQSTWHALENRLPGQHHGRYRYSFAGVAVGVAAIGMSLGLWLGQSPSDTNGQTSWSSLLEEGALLVEGGDWTLDQVYLAAGSEEEEDLP